MPKKIRVYELAKELGLTNKEGLELALSLGIGVKSVETYRARVSEKLGLQGRAELFRYALENGMILPSDN